MNKFGKCVAKALAGVSVSLVLFAAAASASPSTEGKRTVGQYERHGRFMHYTARPAAKAVQTDTFRDRDVQVVDHYKHKHVVPAWNSSGAKPAASRTGNTVSTLEREVRVLDHFKHKHYLPR